MANPFGDLLAEHVRLSILRALDVMPGRTANDSVLCGALQQFGLGASRDQVRTALGWLAEQGLVTTRAAGATIAATATERGLDAAAGRAVVPGVQRPGPAADAMMAAAAAAGR